MFPTSDHSGIKSISNEARLTILEPKQKRPWNPKDNGIMEVIMYLIWYKVLLDQEMDKYPMYLLQGTT
jgi:predicted transposase YdaD